MGGRRVAVLAVVAVLGALVLQQIFLQHKLLVDCRLRHGMDAAGRALSSEDANLLASTRERAVIKECPQGVTIGRSKLGTPVVRKDFGMHGRFWNNLRIQKLLQSSNITMKMTAFSTAHYWIEWDMADGERRGEQWSAERVRYLEDAARSHRVIHGDLHCGNFMWHGGRLVLIDFDDAFVYASVLDLFNGWNLYRGFSNLWLALRGAKRRCTV